MVQKINEENNEGELAYILVANYQKPGELINAQNSTYLITKKIKSPMGAYLSAFSSLENAKKVENELGGKIYNWQQLKEKFKD
jgi:copper chaperone NosL